METFIPGSMYHIDGIIQDGRQFMRAFSYMRPPLAMTQGLPVADYTLPIEDPIHHHLIAYTQALLAKMPGIINGSFHLEVFINQRFQLLETFLEILFLRNCYATWRWQNFF